MLVFSLSSLLSRTRENEVKYTRQHKQCRIELDRQQKELEGADVFPDTTSNSEVAKQRQLLLSYNNKLAQHDDVQYQLDYKKEWLVILKSCF